jgi:hypothetical protein
MRKRYNVALRPLPPHKNSFTAIHSQCLFDTQDTGPAYIRVRLQLARGPPGPPYHSHTVLDHLLGYSHTGACHENAGPCGRFALRRLRAWRRRGSQELSALAARFARATLPG